MMKKKSGQPSVVSDVLIQSVDQKICERWHFIISEVLATANRDVGPLSQIRNYAK
jgi:hypothetical protein